MAHAMVNKQAINGYGRSAVESELDYASPHRIIQMLMDGALSKIAIAKGCIDRGDMAGKVRHTTWAVNIISGLRASLDEQQGGEIASNLDALYEYMCTKLHEATINNDVNLLDEVTSLLAEIKAGWDAIPPEFH